MWFLDAMHGGWGGGWGWMAFGAAWMVFFWGGVIALVVWGISRLTDGRVRGGEKWGSESRPPLDIAKERYARGEITREQFQRLQQDLR